jgi:cobalt transporter subunit CbtA
VLSRVLATALIAGLVAGFFLAAAQNLITSPLIILAETYEHLQPHDTPFESETIASVALARTVHTFLASIALSIGYSLILQAVMLLCNEKINPQNCCLWAVCAFAATGLATGLELAPQLPGAAEADVHTRQIWWAATALATSCGLYLLIKFNAWIIKIIGFLLIIAPHLAPPHTPVPQSAAPAELAAHFAAAALSLQALSWILTGLFTGIVYHFLSTRNSKATL